MLVWHHPRLLYFLSHGLFFLFLWVVFSVVRVRVRASVRVRIRVQVRVRDTVNVTLK